MTDVLRKTVEFAGEIKYPLLSAEKDINNALSPRMAEMVPKMSKRDFLFFLQSDSFNLAPSLIVPDDIGAEEIDAIATLIIKRRQPLQHIRTTFEMFGKIEDRLNAKGFKNPIPAYEYEIDKCGQSTLWFPDYATKIVMVDGVLGNVPQSLQWLELKQTKVSKELMTTIGSSMRLRTLGIRNRDPVELYGLPPFLEMLVVYTSVVFGPGAYSCRYLRTLTMPTANDFPNEFTEGFLRSLKYWTIADGRANLPKVYNILSKLPNLEVFKITVDGFDLSKLPAAVSGLTLLGQYVFSTTLPVYSRLTDLMSSVTPALPMILDRAPNLDTLTLMYENGGQQFTKVYPQVRQFYTIQNQSQHSLTPSLEEVREIFPNLRLYSMTKFELLQEAYFKTRTLKVHIQKFTYAFDFSKLPFDNFVFDFTRIDGRRISNGDIRLPATTKELTFTIRGLVYKRTIADILEMNGCPYQPTEMTLVTLDEYVMLMIEYRTQKRTSRTINQTLWQND